LNSKPEWLNGAGLNGVSEEKAAKSGDPNEIVNPPKISRDMTDKGHFGTGDFEISIKNMADFEVAKPYVEMAYQKIGG